jgi:hypothetical protein
MGLEQVFRAMRDEREWYSFNATDEEWIKDRQAQCNQSVRDGGLKCLPPL